MNTQSKESIQNILPKEKKRPNKMSSGPYPLTDILAVARVHPFYSQEEYPPTAETLSQVLLKSKEEAGSTLELNSMPLLRKETL